MEVCQSNRQPTSFENLQFSFIIRRNEAHPGIDSHRRNGRRLREPNFECPSTFGSEFWGARTPRLAGAETHELGCVLLFRAAGGTAAADGRSGTGLRCGVLSRWP